MKTVALCNTRILVVAICAASSVAGIAQDQQFAVGSGQVTQSGEHATSLARILRPMSSIELRTAALPVSLEGQQLPQPVDEAAELSKLQPTERQYIAGPWTTGHPHRNTYPLRHRPLYFEDPNLERCGQSAGCLTELTSAIHFGARIPALPCMMASSPPHDCARSLPDCPTCSSFGPEAYWPTLALRHHQP